MLSAVMLWEYSYPAMQLMLQPAHQGFPQPGPLVLRPAPFKTRTIPLDRGRTVLRRSEPSSRTALTGEQTDPWHLLQRQDAVSRHRGSEPRRRYGRSGATTLLSPG